MKTKITIAVVLIIIIGISCLMGYIRTCLLCNVKKHKPDEKIFNSDGLRKALLLFQPSRHNSVNELVIRIVSIFNSYGFSVVQNHASEVVDYDFNEFDTIILVTPVYMGSTAQPISDFLENNFFANKDLYLISSGLVDTETTELDKLKKLVKGNNKIYTLKSNKKAINEFDSLLKKNIEENG